MAKLNPVSEYSSLSTFATKKSISWQVAKEGLIKGFCVLCAILSVLTTFGIVYTLGIEALHFFQRVPMSDFFSGTEWTPTFADPSYGVQPLVRGTFMVTVGAACVALPIGLLASIYLSEYANHKVRSILKPLLEILAGIPSVVYGYFAITFVTPTLRQFFGDNVNLFNALSASIVVGIMILPLVSSLCEDALSAVPKALREGAYGLGATKLEVTGKIVVPAALSGIVASFILAISRAVGETMAVSLAAGSMPSMTLNPFEGTLTMTAFIVNANKGDTPVGTTAYYSQYAVGLLLFLVTLMLNLGARAIVKKFRQVYV